MRFLTIQRQFAFLQRLLLSALCEAGINDRNRDATGATEYPFTFTPEKRIYIHRKSPFPTMPGKPHFTGAKICPTYFEICALYFKIGPTFF